MAALQHRFQRKTQAGVIAIAFSLFALLGVAGALGSNRPSDRLVGSFFLLICGLLAVRGARAATVLQDDSRVIVRQLLRTYRLPRHKVQVFRSRTGIVGLYGRDYLAVDTTGGRVLEFKLFNSQPDDPSPGAVPAVVAQLNTAWGLPS